MGEKDDIRDRLFKVTSDFSLLLKKRPPSREIETTAKQDSSLFEKRAHKRKDASIYGIFETENEQFRTSTKNVSVGGVLIDPETHLSFHEDISMTFLDSKFNGRIRTNGKVARVDPDGVGIQFDQVIPVMSSL